MKDLYFVGSSLDDLRRFPEAAKRATGFQLHLLQEGLEPTDWRPMSSIGPGVREIRVSAGGAFRVIYLATRPEGVYVLHAFQKKTQKTEQKDIELARRRLQQVAAQ